MHTIFLKTINYQIQITQILIVIVTVKHFYIFWVLVKLVSRCDEPSAPTTRPPVVFSLRSQFFAFRTQKYRGISIFFPEIAGATKNFKAKIFWRFFLSEYPAEIFYLKFREWEFQKWKCQGVSEISVRTSGNTQVQDFSRILTSKEVAFTFLDGDEGKWLFPICHWNRK